MSLELLAFENVRQTMTASALDRGTQIAVVCPSCSPETECVHEVIKPADRATVRCLECSHVHKVTIEAQPTISIRTIVSTESESDRTSAEVPTDAQLAIGEEFVVEVDGAPMGVRITSLERRDGNRSEVASATEIETIWTRGIDNVAVSATVHPADSDREGTTSETYYLPGDEELTVGESIPHLDESIRITGIVLRDDARGYTRHKLDRRGRSALAKDVDRLYARRADTGDTWKSPWQ